MSDAMLGSTKLYRSRRSVIFGVCRGIADYYDFSVFWTRAIVLTAFILTGFWPVGAAYLIAAFVMKKEPGGCAWQPRHDWHVDVTVRADPGSGSGASLDDRIRRMEAAASRRAYDWDRRLYNGR